MNIHPLFVHFPIGILVVYSAFEIVRFQIVTKRVTYFEIKAMLVTLGTLCAFLATATGDMAEDIMKKTDPSKLPLIEAHSMYAGAVLGIFSLLTFGYVIEWCTRNSVLGCVTRYAFLQKCSRTILKYSILLSVLGLIAISITGGLGSAIVYGQDADPFVTIIYRLFSLL